MPTHSSPINRLTAAARYLTKLRQLAVDQGVHDVWVSARDHAENALHEVEMSIKEIAEQEARF